MHTVPSVLASASLHVYMPVRVLGCLTACMPVSMLTCISGLHVCLHVSIHMIYIGSTYRKDRCYDNLPE